MSGAPPGQAASVRETIRAILGIARGRPEALRLFGDTPQAFIASLDRDGLLGKYRASVDTGVHQVHRAAGDFHPVHQRIADGMGAGKAW